ncbi:uncharacterized protein I303_104010 [Kwoniella dejecticola CBS 10117]|uniref:Uncharacterized protein n=1 Tax=Kwoniella dejecticola CBS 10117 TaxID=1296121 RepID=A0A1A6A8C1_9TREE|nr:uncharacterized protein I303_04029 [Kwoniella dejecticola CBS 10117]OBR86305.1 hypothetical protein I303_04029 [Kwoniella dejecticola CBS 10117]
MSLTDVPEVEFEWSEVSSVGRMIHTSRLVDDSDHFWNLDDATRSKIKEIVEDHNDGADAGDGTLGYDEDSGEYYIKGYHLQGFFVPVQLKDTGTGTDTAQAQNGDSLDAQMSAVAGAVAGALVFEDNYGRSSSTHINNVIEDIGTSATETGNGNWESISQVPTNPQYTPTLRRQYLVWHEDASRRKHTYNVPCNEIRCPGWLIGTSLENLERETMGVYLRNAGSANRQVYGYRYGNENENENGGQLVFGCNSTVAAAGTYEDGDGLIQPDEREHFSTADDLFFSNQDIARILNDDADDAQLNRHQHNSQIYEIVRDIQGKIDLVRTHYSYRPDIERQYQTQTQAQSIYFGGDRDQRERNSRRCLRRAIYEYPANQIKYPFDVDEDIRSVFPHFARDDASQTIIGWRDEINHA